MIMDNLNIEYRSLDELIPYANNARTHSDTQVAQIAASIAEFGFVNPVLVDEDGVLIAGHGRLMAARQLGMERVPSIQISHLSEAQRKALVIADNRIALNAGWDEALLKLELETLDDLDFDLDLLGFDPSEIDDFLFAEDEDEEQEEETIPEVPEEAISKPGDVWITTPDGRDLAVARKPKYENNMIRAVGRGHHYLEMLEADPDLTIMKLAEREKLDHGYIAKTVRMTQLAPDIIEAILNGRQPYSLSLTDFMKPFPNGWEEQRQHFGFS